MAAAKRISHANTSSPYSSGYKASKKPRSAVTQLTSLFLLLILLFPITVVRGLSGQQQRLKQGSSLSVENLNNLLVSPKGTFSSGFYKVGNNAYCFSIWFTNSFDKTVVWIANRDNPVNGKNSRLTIHGNGNLALTDGDGSTVWSTNTFLESGEEVRLLETGNLVLTNKAGRIIWESFKFPTDTLLALQPLTKNTTLVSARNQGKFLSGFYNLKFDDNNVLNLVYNGPQISSVYWPSNIVNVFDSGRTPYNSTRRAILHEDGRFASSDNLIFNASDSGARLNRRLTLDHDGVVRLYSLDESTGLWNISWQPGGLNTCLVHGLCGAYAVCTYKNSKTTCTCPDGFRRSDPADWSKGCSPRFKMTCNPADLDFLELPRVDYFGYDLETFSTGVSLEHCQNLCLNDCRCRGFGYALDGQGQCFPKGSLLNGHSLPNTRIIMYVKVPRRLRSSFGQTVKAKVDELNCSTAEVIINNSSDKQKTNNDRYLKYLTGFLIAVALIEIILFFLGWWYFLRKRVHDEMVNMGYNIVRALGFKRFTYAELQSATRNFKEEIGKGGFGTVYKGVLDDERAVAVKRLEGALQGEAEFWAEVSIIGKINHRNLVKLWGFCAEKGHKLLVYEFLENGSLDRILFTDLADTLGWEQRYNIAVGTAKGLSYLHEECLEWVLHCDVKAENILLDDCFEAKVADFGMSKLFKKEINESGFSRVRGTRGYLAPEWMLNLKIDAKADVYSYGVVLLELLTGKTASGFQSTKVHDNECNHLVQWVTQKIQVEGPEKIFDERVNGEDSKEKLKRMLTVAMLCIREDRDTRPAMSKVVELLVENDEIHI